MPKLNGFELRDKVHTDELLQSKCIPYLFFFYHFQSKIGGECLQHVGAVIFCKPNFNGRTGKNHLCYYGVLETLRGAKRCLIALNVIQLPLIISPFKITK